MMPSPCPVAEIGIRRSRASDDWASADLAAIARVLQETTGLVFPPSRREPAEAGMRRTMERLGLDAFDLRRAIGAPGDARDALVTEITVGETFFFREPGQLDFLRESVLPALRESIGDTRPLRIWSAGSATGEEAYALSMVLREAGWPWPAAILGTDLVPARLASARRGRYTQWSMRGAPEAMIERYFRREGAHFVVREDIRRDVEFRVLNLVADEYPSSKSGVIDMDVVFCRNVLIYFDMPNVEMIVRRLLASLAPGGWLFLGASDPAIADIAPCEVVLTGAGLAYRRLREGAGTPRRAGVPSEHSVVACEISPAAPDMAWPYLDIAAAAQSDVDGRATPTVGAGAFEIERSPAVESATTQSLEIYDEAYQRGDYDRAASDASRAIERGAAEERAWTVLVRSLANQGKLDAAGEAAAAALDHHGMSAEVSYLNGMLLVQSGRHADGAAAFKRALYLDSGFAVAHVALGDALVTTGDMTGARRAYANADSLLGTMNPDAAVPGADGLPAARLLHIARYHLQRLSAAGPPAHGGSAT